MSSSYKLALVCADNDNSEPIMLESVAKNLSTISHLRCLVESCPDSLSFYNDGFSVKYLPSNKSPDIPWHNDVGAIIENHFQFALMIYMPVGNWRLIMMGE